MKRGSGASGQDVLLTQRSKTYIGETVAIDNFSFENCRFINCNLLYGGGPWMMLDCAFEGALGLQFQGAARYTIQLMSFLEQEQVQAEDANLNKKTPPVV